MANAYTLNQVPTTYGNAFYLLITMLLGAGWTVQSSGDGLAAYSAVGNVFTNGGAVGANGFGQALAWARLQDPAGTREIIYQRNASNGVRIKYSPSAKFIGGTPSATQAPTATDQQFVGGGGTESAPTYYTPWLNTAASTANEKFQGAALGTAPYGFWFGGTVVGSGQCYTALCMDPTVGEAVDNDPYVWTIAGNTSYGFQYAGLNLSTGNPSGASGYNSGCFYNTALTTWLTAPASGFYTNSTQVNGSGGAVSPFTGNTVGLPIFYYRDGTLATAQGPKGISTFMRWTSVTHTTSIDTAANKAYICMGSVWLPWDGVTTPSG